MVSNQDGLSSGWPIIRVVFHLASLSSGWSLIRVVFHHGGLLSRWSLIRCSTVFKSFQTLRIVGRISDTCLKRLKPSDGTMNWTEPHHSHRCRSSRLADRPRRGGRCARCWPLSGSAGGVPEWRALLPLSSAAAWCSAELTSPCPGSNHRWQ